MDAQWWHVYALALTGDPVAVAWLIEQLELQGTRLGLDSRHNQGYPT